MTQYQAGKVAIVHEWVEKLLKVQDKDLRIAKLQEQVDSVPTEKARVERILQDSQDQLAAARTRVTDEEKAIKHLEMEAESLDAKQRDFETKSAMIKDNDEYRAAMHQIEMCRKKVSDLEDRELGLMEDLEEARAALADQKKTHAATEKRVEQMLADLDTRGKNCQAQIEKLQSERDALAAEVPGKYLSKYERLRNSRRSGLQPALVPVNMSNVCGGCHMNIPAQDRVNAANGLVVTCPNCSAMIYFDEG